MPPKKDPTPIFIDGPKMDWSMDDGLYSRFQDWSVNLSLMANLQKLQMPGKSIHSFDGLDHLD